MWVDLMVDTETMGLPPDGAVCSIGCAFFSLETLEVGPTFYQVVHLATAVRDGGSIDPGTVMWWLKQSEAARHGILFNGRDNRLVLSDLFDFVVEHSDIEQVRPWGNGTSFDMTLIHAAYKRINEQTPWRFWNERDFRSIRSVFPSVEYNTDDKPADVAHNALGDALFQIEHLFKIKRSRQRG